MARKKGSMSLSGNLEVKAGAPLDARMIVPTEEDLIVASNFPYKYVGMPVIVQDTGSLYILKSADVTDLANWNRVEGGDFIQKTTLPAPSASLTGVIYQYVGNDTVNLKKGYFYKCDGTKWDYCPVQKTEAESISLKVSKQGYVTTVVAEDPSGVTTTYILDGKDGVDGVDGISPSLSIGETGNWVVNSIDTGVPARGEKGERGEGFKISATYATPTEMVEATDETEDSTVVLVESTNTMFIRLIGYDKGEYLGWMEIGGLGDMTVIKGDKGEPGQNGVTPTIDPTSKHWMIGDHDTGVVAQGTNGTNGTNGANGITPSINPTTKHWMLGATDTGVVAQGQTPTIDISADNTWVINGTDTGKGASPTIDDTTKHWIVDGEDTGIVAKGAKGDTGDDGFSPTITSERVNNKVIITVHQKTGTATIDIYDGLNAYDDSEVRADISTLESDVDTLTTSVNTLNGDATIAGSVSKKIADALKDFTSIKFEKVITLPVTGTDGVIYLVPLNDPKTKNIYKEYIWIDSDYETLGTTEIDLSGYALKTDIPTKVSQLTNDSKYLTTVPKATVSDVGGVKPDGTTITIDADGTIHGSPETGVSAATGNILEEKADGLYVPATDLSTYAKTSAIPTKTSQLTNNGADNTSTYVEKKELKTVATSGSYSDLTDVPTKLSQFTNDLIATTKKAGTVIPDGSTVTIDGNGTITATIGENSLSRDEGNQIELHDDGIYIGALNEEAIYDAIDAVDLASPILTEYTEDELYHLAWEEIEVKEKEEYTEAELDEILDGIDFSGAGGGGGSGDANVIESISVNGVNIPPDANKNIALTIMTNSVNDLVNYYKKTETYTKTEVDNLIDVIGGGKFEVVESLPTEDINLKAIYLVAKVTSETSNVYDEYVYINSAWEKIGDTQIDLSDYITADDLEDALENKLDAQEISQADFEALSQAEKDNGTAYFISDGDGLVSKTAMGYTPIGTVISVMGNTAPKHYLACDGSVVNILDYPELANYFNTQFGSKNYFGGDGVTTFAVPDLRGEFLRGSGTNGHANQGNGGVVGEHQNSTVINTTVMSKTDSRLQLWGTNSDYAVGTYNLDKSITTKKFSYGTVSSQVQSSASETGSWDDVVGTIRPTNTSVLYCIATKNIYIDPKNNYSTEEQVVGTWIDGKPIYQKTFNGTTHETAGNWSIINIDAQVATVISTDGKINASHVWVPLNNYRGDSVEAWVSITVTDNSHSTPNRINIKTGSSYISKPFTITLQYTKTTD